MSLRHAVLLVDASDRGGIARYTAASFRDLRDHDVDVGLVAPAGRAVDARSITHIPWGDEIAGRSRARHVIRLAWAWPVRAWSLLGAIRASRPEIVHLQGFVGGPFDPLLVRWWRLRGIKVVRTVHDPEPQVATNAARRDVRTWRLVDALIVHSAAARGIVAAAAPATKVVVIPPDLLPTQTPRRADEVVVADAPSRDEARRQLGLDDAPRVLLLGILSPYKGAELLVEAWPLVRAKRPTALLSVVGSVPAPFDALDRLTNLGGVEAVLRWLDDDEVPRWAAAADLVVLPYEVGSHSGILHQAVGAEVPVLASPVLAEEVERFQAGRVVALDPVAWADAIVEALDGRLPRPRPPSPGSQARATIQLYRELGASVPPLAPVPDGGRAGPGRSL